jgi:hypothetical protein
VLNTGSKRKREPAQIVGYQPRSNTYHTGSSNPKSLALEGYNQGELERAVLGQGSNKMGQCAEPHLFAKFNRELGPIKVSYAARLEGVPGKDVKDFPKVWRYKEPCQTCSAAYLPETLGDTTGVFPPPWAMNGVEIFLNTPKIP